MAVDNKSIIIEPISFGIKRFKVEALLSDKFLAELKKELPTSQVGHLCIGFSDSKDIVMIGYDRQEGKFILDRVDVEGTNPAYIGRTVEVLKRVIA